MSLLLVSQASSLPLAIGAALARVRDDSELRSSLGRRAREAVAVLSWDVAAERLRGLLEEAVSVRSRRG